MFTFSLFFVLIIMFLSGTHIGARACAKDGSSKTSVAKIKEDIFCNYDKEYRPVRNQKRLVNVTIRLVLKSIDVGYTEQEMTIKNWMGVSWRDEYLTWKPADYDNIDSIHISSDDIWTPDLSIHKKDDSKVIESNDCLLTSNGLVVCVTENMHDSTCTTNLEKWPYDTQLCNIKYTTTSYNKSQVRLKFNKERIILSGFIASPEWKLINVTSKMMFYRLKSQTYQLLSFSFSIERHAARFEATLFVPALSLIIMTLVPLWLCLRNAERLCIVCVNILCHFLFIQQAGWIVPTNGAILPKSVTFFQISLCMSVSVLIELTLMKGLLSRRTSAPNFVFVSCKMISNSIFGRTMLIEQLQGARDEDTIAQIDSNEITSKQKYEEHFLIATVIDKLMFVAFCITYSVLILTMIPM